VSAVTDLHGELYLSANSRGELYLSAARTSGGVEDIQRMLALIKEADVAFASEESRAAYDADLAARLRITIAKAEAAGDDETLARAADALAWMIFRVRNAETDEEARDLAARALAIDSTLSQAGQVIATLEAEALVNVPGGPVWVALDVDLEHGRALMITRDIVAKQPYNQEKTDITWESCSLRKWLNSAFFDSLPAQVKPRLIEVTIQNPDNSEYGTTGGKPTTDRVFLLSIDEARRYFSDDASRIASFNGSARWWWLRSPGSHQHLAADVRSDGAVIGLGYGVYDVVGGVRPALFLNLDA
jgi:hypothetical protein